MGKRGSLIIFVLLFAVAAVILAVQQLEQMNFLKHELHQRQAYKKAISTLENSSPAAPELLRKHGIDFATSATFTMDNRVKVQLSFDYGPNKVVYFLPADRYDGPSPNEPHFLNQQDGSKFSIVDWQSGGEDGIYRQRFASTILPGQLSVDNLVLQTQAFYLVLEPDDYYIDFSELQGHMPVDQTISCYDAEFRIHELRVSDDQVIIRYSQVTPVEEAGLYLLYFNITDSLGNCLVLPQDILKTNLCLQNPREFIHHKPQVADQDSGLKLAGVIQVIPPFEVPLSFSAE